MPRLVLPDTSLPLSRKEWGALHEIAQLTAATPTSGVLSKELWPDTSAHDRAKRRAFQALTQRGVLIRTPRGWTMPPTVRSQVMRVGRLVDQRQGMLGNERQGELLL